MKYFPITTLALLASLASTQAEVQLNTPSAAQERMEIQLQEGEKKLRDGMMLLAELCQCLSVVNDKDSAEAAVPKLMKLHEALSVWAQSFSSIPPLSEPEVAAYEDKYLPSIRKINHLLEMQASRIAAAEYYGSLNLPSVLVRLAMLNTN